MFVYSGRQPKSWMRIVPIWELTSRTNPEWCLLLLRRMVVNLLVQKVENQRYPNNQGRRSHPTKLMEPTSLFFSDLRSCSLLPLVGCNSYMEVRVCTSIMSISFLRPMPEEPHPAAEWLLPKLLKDLSDAKLLPLKINHLKHQEALRSLSFFRHIMHVRCVGTPSQALGPDTYRFWDSIIWKNYT